MKEDWYNPSEYICATCGKKFYRDDITHYAYRRTVPNGKSTPSTYTFCGWNCMRAWDRKQEEIEEAKKREPKPPPPPKPKVKPLKDAYRPIIIYRPNYSIRKCGKCGRQISMNAKHCKSCGAKIDWGLKK